MSLDYALSDQPTYGKWTIRVSAQGQIEEEHFYVEEYYQTRFEVSLAHNLTTSSPVLAIPTPIADTTTLYSIPLLLLYLQNSLQYHYLNYYLNYYL